MVREVAVHDPGAGVVAHHLHSRRGGREDLQDVPAVRAVRAVRERLPVEVDRVVVEGGAESQEVPGHHVAFLHHQPLHIPEDAPVDGVHAVAELELPVGEVRALGGALLHVVQQVPAEVLVEDVVQHPELTVNVNAGIAAAAAAARRVKGADVDAAAEGVGFAHEERADQPAAHVLDGVDGGEVHPGHAVGVVAAGS